MLLWKSWRDLRIAFFVGLGWLALIAAGVIDHALRSPAGSPGMWASPEQAFRVASVFITMQTFVFTLLALAFGSFGVGRDIGAGSGTFALTRPIPRGFYVWTEWLAGLLALCALDLLSFLGLWLAVHAHALRITFVTSSDHVQTIHNWTVAAIPLGPTILDICCALLFLALIFGITHLGTVAFRHSTAGLLCVLGFLVAWFVGTAILRHEYLWLGPYIPDLLLRPYGSIDADMRLIPHVTASILERLAILPLFPLAAQFLLRRTEV